MKKKATPKEVSLPRRLKNMRIQVLDTYLFDAMFTLRMLKTKYGDDLDDMLYDMPALDIPDSAGVSLLDEIKMVWDDIYPIYVIDIVQQIPDAERARAIFQYLPTATMFDEGSEELHVATVETKQVEEDGSTRVINNVYRLIRKKTSKLFPKLQPGQTLAFDYLYAVEVRCVTTDKVYRLLVPESESFCKQGSYDAAAAIAWTVRPPITNPKALVRQGEKFLWIHSSDSVVLPAEQWKHLTKKEYFKYLVFQS